jgi:TolB-like protein
MSVESAWALTQALRAPVSPAHRAPKFAVLPLESLSSDAELQAFAAGLEEEIAAGLNDGRLQVASSAQIGRTELERSGVDFTIGGVVERDDNRLRARMRLPRPASSTTARGYNARPWASRDPDPRRRGGSLGRSTFKEIPTAL